MQRARARKNNHSPSQRGRRDGSRAWPGPFPRILLLVLCSTGEWSKAGGDDILFPGTSFRLAQLSLHTINYRMDSLEGNGDVRSGAR